MSEVKTFIDSFDNAENFQTLRKEALDKLQSASFPDRKSEEWKYTRTVKLTKKAFHNHKLESELDVAEFAIPDVDVYRLVFINGYFREDLSDTISDQGCTAGNLSKYESSYKSSLDSNGVFSTINAAFFTDGLFLEMDKNVKLSKPIHVVHLSVGELVGSQMRHIIRLNTSSEADVIFSYHGSDENTRFNNVVLEAEVGENAGLNILKVQSDKEGTNSINKETIKQSKDSRFQINTLTTGGSLVRNDLKILVEGSNAYSTLNGAYILDTDQHVDNHTVVDHKVADCESSELYKGVMRDNSTGVFNGKVFVREDAQRINAFQSNANVLLSDTAAIYTKPELEIYADDVKCSHGSTTGQLDDEAVFYLRARGMSKASAEQLLVKAFVKEVFENINDENLVDWINELIEKKFDRK